jgi:hypothetical protein
MRSSFLGIVGIIFISGGLFCLKFKRYLPAMAVGALLINAAPVYSFLTYAEILMAISVSLYFVDLVLKVRTFSLKNALANRYFLLFSVPAVVFIFQLVAKFMGYSSLTFQGAKIAVRAVIVMVFAAYCLGGVFDRDKFYLIPRFCLFFCLVLLAIDIVNVMVPSSAYFTYYVNTKLNHEVMAELVMEGGNTIRVAQLSNFVLIVGSLLTVAHLTQQGGRLTNSFLKTVMWLIVLASIGVLSGYRRVLIYTALMFFVLFVYYRGWRLVSYLFVGVFGYLLLLNVDVSVFPESIQRALSVLPGIDIYSQSASDSSNFRFDLWETFFKEYFPHHMWFGRGQDLPEYAMATYGTSLRIELLQMWHSIIVTLLDYVGLVGTIPFLLAGLSYFGMCIRFFYERRVDEPWKIWILIIGIIVLVRACFTGQWIGELGVYIVFLPLFYLPNISSDS